VILITLFVSVCFKFVKKQKRGTNEKLKEH